MAIFHYFLFDFQRVRVARVARVACVACVACVAFVACVALHVHSV